MSQSHNDYPATLLDPLPDQIEPSRRTRPVLGEWLCLIAGLVLLNRYAWLMDDAYIYFRYIDNWLFLDYGLVYNQGEYVEGFSSPLWVLVLGLLRSLRLDYWLIVRMLGCAAFVACWLGLVALNRKLAPRDTVTANLPLAYLALNYGILTYFTSGLESPLVSLFAVVYALFAVTPSSQALQFLIAVSPLVRQEFALPLLLCFLWKCVRDQAFAGFLFAMAALWNGLYLLFRVYYYADLFPNTFYLKDMVDFRQGLAYVLDTALPYHLFWYLGVFAIVAIVLITRRRMGESLHLEARGLMIVLALCLTAYVVKIGGDPRHFRYLAWPFCLLVCATSGLPEHLLLRLSRLNRAQVGFAATGLVAAFSAWLYPIQLDHHPALLKFGDRTVNKINDAHRHRTNPGGPGRMPPFSPPWNALTMEENLSKYETPNRAYQGVKAESGCAIIYRDPFVHYVHSFGLTDPVLARTVMASDRPGHKRGLIPMAAQLVELRRATGVPGAPGTFRILALAPRTPDWVAGNLPSLEVIEKKAFNKHDLVENFRLALQFPERIRPTGVPPAPPAPSLPEGPRPSIPVSPAAQPVQPPVDFVLDIAS